ncbi:MAG TPA: globin [Candidatus Eisenbacteria bacterium]|jgi:hemoglobin-like flavoprotein
MTLTEIEIFDDSLSRCYANPRFLERFYDIFLESSPEARAKFAGADLTRQRRMLKASLVLMMLGAGGSSEGLVHMERIGRLHGKAGHAIPAHLYDVWLDCLLQAVREFDPQCDDALLQVWRNVLAPGIAFMKSRYDSPFPEH